MADYSQKNQTSGLSDTEIIVGGLIAVAVIGGLVYYFATRNTSSTTANAAVGGLTQAQVNAAFPQTAGMTPDQQAAFLSGDINAQGVPTS